MTEEIQNDNGGKKYFGTIPHMAGAKLDVYEHRLYAHYIEICGMSRADKCTQAERTIYTSIGMSKQRFKAARKGLIDKGFITFRPGKPNKKGQKGYAALTTIIDIWEENIKFCKANLYRGNNIPLEGVNNDPLKGSDITRSNKYKKLEEEKDSANTQAVGADSLDDDSGHDAMWKKSKTHKRLTLHCHKCQCDIDDVFYRYLGYVPDDGTCEDDVISILCHDCYLKRNGHDDDDSGHEIELGSDGRLTDESWESIEAGTIWHKAEYSAKYDKLNCEVCKGEITDTFYHYGGWYRYKVHCAGCWLKKYGSVDNSDNTQFDNGGHDDRQCVKCGALAVIGDDIPYVGDVQTPDGGYKHGLLCPKCAGYDDECIVEIHTDDNATADMTAKVYPRSELVKPRNWNDLQDCSVTERCEAQQVDDTVHYDHTCNGCGTVAALNKHGYCDDCVSAMRDAKLPKAKKVTAHTAMKNALVAAMGYTNEEITCWGDYNKASKLLRKAGVEPAEIPGMHAFCMAWSRKGDYTFKSPMQLAKDLPEYRKQQRQAQQSKSVGSVELTDDDMPDASAGVVTQRQADYDD